jgi:hypothetical protein
MACIAASASGQPLALTQVKTKASDLKGVFSAQQLSGNRQDIQ